MLARPSIVGVAPVAYSLLGGNRTRRIKLVVLALPGAPDYES